MKKDHLIIAKKSFKSRLIVGTGKYKNMQECAKAIKISGAEIVTVAVRRVNISDNKKPLLMDYIDPKKITYLPNTAGCFNSVDALRTLRHRFIFSSSHNQPRTKNFFCYYKSIFFQI